MHISLASLILLSSIIIGSYYLFRDRLFTNDRQVDTCIMYKLLCASINNKMFVSV